MPYCLFSVYRYLNHLHHVRILILCFNCLCVGIIALLSHLINTSCSRCRWHKWICLFAVFRIVSLRKSLWSARSRHLNTRQVFLIFFVAGFINSEWFFLFATLYTSLILCWLNALANDQVLVTDLSPFCRVLEQA